MKIKSSKYWAAMSSAFVPMFMELANAKVDFKILLLYCISHWVFIAVEGTIDIIRIIKDRYGPEKAPTPSATFTVNPPPTATASTPPTQ